ncbi:MULTISPECIES: hypothetical protein [Bifidobacterium]|uniref:hypothetical protein n=1 Tax=Bifidobacterium TaxID=1678 RepID=UPI001BDBE371|nr:MULTISPECIES: hypothetical protein [Bifidobacterium]MBT1160696.1 hypothetical protein [Bifidobacterium sp. SO1]MBW3077887.1 hypothetical protein [Bifidobacterium simiiventris]
MTDSQTNNGDQPDEQPQYGQYQQPEYGAMANQYPAGYDPYVYGKPQEQPAAQQQSANGQQQATPAPNQYQGEPTGKYMPFGGPAQIGTPYEPAQQNGGQGQPYGNAYRQQPVPPHTPRYINGIDVEDPNQNPLYGRWDMLSIFSLVCALLFPLPVLPAIMGAASMRRTRLFHMKGFWLGFAAVFINVFYTIMVIWLAVNGMSMFDYYQQMLDMLESQTGDGGTGGTVSA